MPTFEQIITAEFDLAAMKELIFKIYTHPHIDGILEHFRAFIESMPIFAWAAILGIVALVFSNFGKKLLAIPLIIGTAAVGYLGGAFLLAPRLEGFVAKYEFIQQFISIDSVVVGIVCAAVCAILFLPLYFLGYTAVIGYFTYLFVYPVCQIVFGDSLAMLIGLGAAATAVIFGFIFRKWVEMIATSVAGAYFVMLAIHLVVPMPMVVNLVIWGVFAVQGAIVQIKTRRRY